MYKPPSISNASQSGLAVVKVNPAKGLVRVTLTKKDQFGNEATTTYDLYKSECPDYIKPGNWRVKLSADGRKMYSATPSEATLICQFAGLAHKEGEEPTPKLQTDSYKNEFLQFILLLKVVEGELEGLEIPKFLRYNFKGMPDPEGGEREVTAYTNAGPKAKHTPELDQALTALGVWDKGPIIWQDNILPVIQKRAMKKANDGRKVIVSISNGYVNAIREHVEAESDWDNEADAGNGPAQEPDPDAEEDTSPNPSAMTDDGESGTEIAMGDGVPWAE